MNQNNQKIVIINYGMGNLNSVKRKLRKINGNAVIANDYHSIESADKLILPGVGHFAMAVNNIKALALWDVLNELVLVKKKPILGICLGMQLMAKQSEEGNVEGFGWFDADVVRFKVNNTLQYKVPHMGWNNVSLRKQSDLFNKIPLAAEFYFVHSFHIQSNKSDEILGTTNYEYEFVSALEKENIIGLQFHPEKSHDVGEKLLLNFLQL